MPAALRDHVGSCLRCQAEVIRYRRLGRQLAGLKRLIETAPQGLVPAVSSRLGSGTAPATSGPRVPKAAAAAGALVAAAGTVAMVRWMRAKSAA